MIYAWKFSADRGSDISGNVNLLKSQILGHYQTTVSRGLLCDCLTYPLGKLSVHHEVVDMFLRPRQLQLPAHHRHQQSRTARALKIFHNIKLVIGAGVVVVAVEECKYTPETL